MKALIFAKDKESKENNMDKQTVVINQYKDQVRNRSEFYSKVLPNKLTMHQFLNKIIYHDANRLRGVTYGYFTARAY